MFLPVNCPYTSAASYIRNPWITLFKFLYLRFFSGKKKFPSSCPNNNLNIQGRVNPETTKNVKSWPACSEICSQREDCNYWISAKKISTGTISTIVQLVQLTCYSFVQDHSRNTLMIVSPCLIMGPQMRMVTLFLEQETVKVDRSAHSTLYIQIYHTENRLRSFRSSGH